MSATAYRRPPWQNPRRLRQVAAGAGVLLLGCLALVLVGSGGGPKPATPVAGLQPGLPTQNLPAVPRTTSTTATTPGATPAPTAVPTPLPTASKPGETRWPAGVASTPYPTQTATPQIVETAVPTPPVATERPPTVTPTSTASPTTPPPTTLPPTSTTPSTPPTTPNDPNQPGGGLGGFLGELFNKLGL